MVQKRYNRMDEKASEKPAKRRNNERSQDLYKTHFNIEHPV